MADDSGQVGQDEIENLLNQAQGAAAPTSPAQQPQAAENAAAVDQAEIEALLGSGTPAAPAASKTSQAEGSTIAQSDIELLLNKAEQALDSIDQPGGSQPGPLPSGVKTFEFQPFSGTSANKEAATLELMRDVQLDMTIELGRTHMHLEDVLKLKQGSVVPLDKLAGDPADIFVNGRLVARGEVLVLNDNFCVRVAELIVGESACA
jgi:flagellar motor switch protein FliN/FliY